MTQAPWMPPPSATPRPGYITSATALPPGLQTLDAPTWSINLAKTLSSNIIAANGNIGMPATWPYGPISPSEVGGGSVSPKLWTQLQTYAMSPAAANDADVASFLGMAKPASTPNDYIPSPAETAAALEAAKFGLSQEAQDFAQAKFAIEQAQSSGGGSGGGTSSRAVSLPRISGGSSGGSSASGSTALSDQMALLNAKYALDAPQQAADNAFRQQQLAQSGSQFQQSQAQSGSQFAQTLAAQQARDTATQNNQHAATYATLAANPNDMVARDYFLHTGHEPTGNPIDVFTGQQSGAPTTQGVLNDQQSPMAGQFLNGTTPPPPMQAPVPPPATSQVAPATPQVAPPTPQLATGTGAGYTTAPKMIVGEKGMEGIQNPTGAPIRVLDHQQMTGQQPMPPPRFATGTDVWGGGADPQDTQNAQPPAQTTQSTLPPVPAGQTSWADMMTAGGYAPRITAMPDQQARYASNYLSNQRVQAALDGPQGQFLNDQSQRTAQLNQQGYDDLGGIAVAPTDWASSSTTPQTAGQRMTDAGLTGAAQAVYQQSTPTQSQYPQYSNYVTPAGFPTTPPPTGGAMPYGADTQNHNTTPAAPPLPGYVQDHLANDPNVAPQVAPQGTVPGVAADSGVNPATGKSNTPPAIGNAEGTAPVGPPPKTLADNPTPPGTPSNNGNTVISGTGMVKTPDGGGTMHLLPGDVNYNGSYLRYNTVSQKYEPVPVAPTLVTSLAQFQALGGGMVMTPNGQQYNATQQAILSGKGTGYAIQNGDGWANMLQMPTQGQQPSMLTQDQFNALPNDQQRNLLDNPQSSPNGGTTGTNGVGYSANRFDKDSPLAGQPTGTYSMNQGNSIYTPYDYNSYVPDSRLPSLYPESFAQPPTPQMQAAAPPVTVAPPPAGGTPSPVPPAATTPPAGTVAPPPATTPPAGTATPPPAGGTATPPPATAGTPPGDLSAISYDPAAYANLPSLQYLKGLVSPADWQNITNQNSSPNGIGGALPAPNQLNYGYLLQLKNSDPSGYAALSAIWRARNRDLDQEMQFAQQRAPVSNGYETTMVSTN